MQNATRKDGYSPRYFRRMSGNKCCATCAAQAMTHPLFEENLVGIEPVTIWNIEHVRYDLTLHTGLHQVCRAKDRRKTAKILVAPA
jgi:hypothetical protein